MLLLASFLILAHSAAADSGPVTAVLWESASAETGLYAPPGAAPGTAIALNRDAVARATAGALVEVSIPGGVVSFSIDRVTVAAGVRTLYGSGGEGGASRLVMTMSERSAYATVSTARGTFSLRAGRDGGARLYSAAELNRNVDRTQPDYTAVRPGLEAQ